MKYKKPTLYSNSVGVGKEQESVGNSKEYKCFGNIKETNSTQLRTPIGCPGIVSYAYPYVVISDQNCSKVIIIRRWGIKIPNLPINF